jgi:metallopeptidase MepB
MVRINGQPLPRMFEMSEIMTTTIRQIEETRKLIGEITKSIDISHASFDTVLKPLVELENAQAGERAAIAGLKYFSPSLECQQMVSKAEDTWREFETLVNLDLYALLNAVRHKKEDLCIESSKLLDKMLLEYEESGYGRLDEVGLERILSRRRDIDRLQAEFHQNLRQRVSHEEFDISELSGLPEELLTIVSEDGKIAIGHNKQFTVMRSALNPQTRQRMQEACHRQRGENIRLFHEVIVFRDENARELSHLSHAATRLPHRCVESLEWVEQLVAALASDLASWSKIEADQLLELKQRHLASHPDIQDDNRDELMPWDDIYYSSLLQKEAQIDHTEISEYFPLEQTINTMLKIFGDFLELRFAPISKEDLRGFVWHEDVTGWTAWETNPDKNDQFVGYLFFDVLARPYKYRGNQSVNIQPVGLSALKSTREFCD